MRLSNKKIFFLYITLPCFAFLLSSCSTSTSITSWKENSGAENKFGKVLVMVLIKDLEYKSALETAMVASLQKNGVNSVKSLDVMSPLVKYSKDDLDTLLHKNNFDGLLTVNYEGMVIEKENRNGIKYSKYYKKYFKPAKRKGNILTHRTVVLESILFSVNSENNVWVATTKTEDALGAEDLSNSVSEILINDLVNKKLIKQPSEK